MAAFIHICNFISNNSQTFIILHFHMRHPILYHCSKSAVGQSVCVIRARQCHRTGHSSCCYLFLNKCCFRQNIHNIKYKDWYYIGILQSAVRTTQVFADLIAPDFFSCRNSILCRLLFTLV